MPAMDAISGRPSFSKNDLESLEKRVVEEYIDLDRILVTKDIYFVIPENQDIYDYKYDNFRSRNILNKYDNTYLISNDNYDNFGPGPSIAYIELSNGDSVAITSPFMTSVQNEKYKLFSADNYQFYFIQ